MKKMLLFAIMFVVLLNNVSAIQDVLGGDIFTVTLVDQSPGTVPAIALEHNSQARVKLFFSISSLAAGNVEYDIQNINFVLREGNQYVTSVQKDSIAQSIGDNLAYDDAFNIGEETIAAANVNLRRVGTGKYVLITDETAQNICNEKDNKTTELGDKIPDQIDLKLQAFVDFKACRGAFDRDSTGKITGCPAGYLTKKDLYSEDSYQSEAQRRIDQCKQDVEEAARRGGLSATEIAERNVNCEKIVSKYGETIRDYVDVDSVIGIDKSNLDLFTDPETLKEQICWTLDKREKVQSLIKKTEKAQNFFESTCAIGVLGAAANYVVGGNVCNTLDSISLGCDWIFCPSEDCWNNLDPFDSIIASTFACFDPQKHFFGKDLIFNLDTKYAETLKNNPDVVKNGDVYSTGNRDLITERSNYVNSACVYPDNNPKNKQVDDAESEGSIKVPHYSCIPGVEGNLKTIDNMLEGYQNCLIGARQGGISTGYCDKLRSYYICDRVFGETIGLFGSSGPQGWLSKAFNKGIVDPVKTILPSQTDEYLNNRKQDAQVLAQQSIARYQNVPFIQLLGKRDQYLRNQLCYAFIDGKLFSLKDLKDQFEVFRVDIPDSAMVNVEMKPWDYYQIKQQEITETTDVKENVISLEVEQRATLTSKLLIASIITQESKWNKNAVSGTGVKGIMQITSSTAQECTSAGIGTYSEIVGSEEKSILCGAKIVMNKISAIKNTVSKTNNPEEKIKLILAAYNAGQGVVNTATSNSQLYDWNIIPQKTLADSLKANKLDSSQATVNEKAEYPNRVLNWYRQFALCDVDANGKLSNCPNGILGYVDDYNKYEDQIESAVIKYSLDEKILEYGFDVVNEQITSSTNYKDVQVNDNGQILVPSEYSYDVFYQIYSGQVNAVTGVRGGAYSIYLKDFTSDVPGVNCPNTVQIATGTVQDGQMVQENVLKVISCKAATQCLQFKGNTVCRDIDETLVYGKDSNPLDPIGLSLFSQDDEDGDGISDAWEVQYFGSNKLNSLDRNKDPDKDNYCTAEEYLRGTDPTDASNYPRKYEPDCAAAIAELDKRVKTGEQSTNNQQANEADAGPATGDNNQGQGNQEETVTTTDTTITFKTISLKDTQGNVINEAPFEIDLVYAVEKSDKYNLVVNFEASRNLADNNYFCKINGENAALSGGVNTNINICAKQLTFTGDRQEYKLTLVDVNSNVVYSKDFSIINSQPKSGTNQFLLCKITDSSNVDYYFNWPPLEPSRCSDFGFNTAYSSQYNFNSGAFGQFVSSKTSLNDINLECSTKLGENPSSKYLAGLCSHPETSRRVPADIITRRVI